MLKRYFLVHISNWFRKCISCVSVFWTFRNESGNSKQNTNVCVCVCACNCVNILIPCMTFCDVSYFFRIRFNHVHWNPLEETFSRIEGKSPAFFFFIEKHWYVSREQISKFYTEQVDVCSIECVYLVIMKKHFHWGYAWKTIDINWIYWFSIVWICLEMAPKNKIDECEKKPIIGRVGTNLRVGIVGMSLIWR